MSLLAILSEYRIPYRLAGQHHHTTKNRISVDCPFCSPNSNKFRLGIHLVRESVNCWICGKVPPYRAYGALGLSPAAQEAIRYAQRNPGHWLPQSTQITQPPSGILTLPTGLGPLLEVHKDYLLQRGFDPEQLTQEWGIQGIGLAPRLSWRVFIPITYQGRMVSWTTRAISPSATLRYITAKPEEESLPSKSILFGADKARHSIIICEGPLDPIKIGYGGTATLGVNYSCKQLREMARFPRRYICFDNEPGAQKRAGELMDDLCDLPGETQNIILDAKDPAEAGESELKQLRGLLE